MITRICDSCRCTMPVTERAPQESLTLNVADKAVTLRMSAKGDVCWRCVGRALLGHRAENDEPVQHPGVKPA